MNKLTIYFAGQRYEKYFIYASARVQVREFYPIFVIFYTKVTDAMSCELSS